VKHHLCPTNYTCKHVSLYTQPTTRYQLKKKHTLDEIMIGRLCFPLFSVVMDF